MRATGRSTPPQVGEASSPSARQRLGALLAGPRLQFLNLSVFLVVVLLTIDFPNPLPYVALCVGTAAGLDAAASRWRYGSWRIPWPSMVASLGICFLVDGYGPLAFVLLAVIMVASKHLVRWRGRHLFNPNNVAASILILAGMVRVGVNDWGAAPQTLGLMLLFGTIATTRVKRFDLAVAYLVFSFVAYLAIAQWYGWGLPTVVEFAFSPLQVLLGFFAITDPATSPEGRTEKLLWAALIVLLAVPATLAGRAEAPIFALLVAAPQRHLVRYLVRGTWPSAPTPRPATTGGGVG